MAVVGELPSPPQEKSGWPWAEESAPTPESMPDGSPWPRISIVTPSYNQGQFLEETIRSVLFQGYPDLEYMVVDGGSTDGSVEIIHKYESWLAYWVSEPDRGQANAINKGFKRATGEIVAWINSDDFYEPGAFAKAVRGLVEHPGASFVYGDCIFADAEGEQLWLGKSHPTDLEEMLLGNVISQPTVFYRRWALEAVGLLREDLNYVMDYELWLRLLANGTPLYLPETLSRFRMYDGTKTFSGESRSWEEILTLLETQYAGSVAAEHFAKAMGLAHAMSGVSFLNEGSSSKAAEHFQRALEAGFFDRASLLFAVKRVLAFLHINGRLDRPMDSPQSLEAQLPPTVSLPGRFWSALFALQELRQAEGRMRSQDRLNARRHIRRAVRYYPPLLFDASLWRLWMYNSLSPGMLIALQRIKRFLLQPKRWLHGRGT